MTPCPSAAKLEQLLDGRLSAAETTEIEAHVETCPDCRQELERLTAPEEEGPPIPPITPSNCGNGDVKPPLPPPSDPNASAAAAADAASIPGFEILGQVGGGGMGVVYLARDKALDRPRALKMPHPAALTRPHVRERFEQEARLLAKLRHPNIVPVHAAGLLQGHPFFVMDYVPGGNLAQHKVRFTADPRLAVELVEKVARAVDYAHGKGILHRDLKPSNILLDGHGQPQVADFGVATLWGAGVSKPNAGDTGVDSGADSILGKLRLTQTDEAVGTPEYMAPEQFEVKTGVERAADVWALGVILYELLTGQPPFQAKTREELRTLVRNATPARPRTLRANLDRRLEAIVLKCLAKDPGGRYPSAGAVADALEEWRFALPVPRGSWLRRSINGATRHPRAVATAGALAVLLTVLAAAVPPAPPTQPPPSLSAEERAELQYREGVKKFEQELAQGRPVTLVGPTTRAFHSRWRAGQGTVTPTPGGGGPVRVTAWQPSLLEVLPDPQRASYRVDLELQHDLSNNASGDIGAYFMYRKEVGPEGNYQFMVRASFADLGPKAMVFRNPDGRPGSRFYLYYCFNGTSDRNPSFGSRRGKTYVSYVPERPFKGPGPSRRFSITVRPGGVKAGWGGKSISVSPASDLKDWGDGLRGRFPELANVPIRLPERGAIGIYVYGGSLSIRRIDVVPLD